MESVEHENQREVLAPFPLIDSSFLDEGIDSYKYLFEENLVEENLVEDLARQCNNKILYGYNMCPLVNKDVGCPFGDNKLCSEITADDWDKLKLYVKEKEEVNMQREANIQREAHTQENNTQEDIAQETKESPVRCYYAFMVKEEKIVFYKGVFTRRKTVPVAFTSESQRDLFVRSTECSYAVSRRQLLHELADAYQDMSITELSRVISEIRRRAISATENSNGAITYSDYLYFDMAEIVFDI